MQDKLKKKEEQKVNEQHTRPLTAEAVSSGQEGPVGFNNTQSMVSHKLEQSFGLSDEEDLIRSAKDTNSNLSPGAQRKLHQALASKKFDAGSLF
jgi:hypothetical protein